jgi:hypothetical protein
MLYIGAIEGTDIWLAPKQVVRMTGTQASKGDALSREGYGVRSLKRGFRPVGKPWYSENSREQIRDETIRQGLIGNNAVTERPGLSTTSANPRYALRADFAALLILRLTQGPLRSWPPNGALEISRPARWHVRYSYVAARPQQMRESSLHFLVEKLVSCLQAQALS